MLSEAQQVPVYVVAVNIVALTIARRCTTTASVSVEQLLVHADDQSVSVAPATKTASYTVSAQYCV
eukprot:16851-Heterococcus_DN1.PRE.2